MSVLETFTRHRIIIQKLRTKSCTFDEIKDTLRRRSALSDRNYEISIRTFQRDIADISELYHIEITYNKSTRHYELCDEMTDEYANRLFEAFDVFQALHSDRDFSAYIQFDTRKPAGTEYLSDLLIAVKERKQIQITYQKFWRSTPEVRRVEPYLLKEFRRRWYVFAYDTSAKDLRVFGLDRIINLAETGLKFLNPRSIDPKSYFNEVFGVIGSSDDFEVRNIILSFRKNVTDAFDIPNQGEYVKSMPLHASQRILKDTSDEIVVQINVKPNWELIMELLSYGEYVEVLEPHSLRQAVHQRLSMAAARYGEE